MVTTKVQVAKKLWPWIYFDREKAVAMIHSVYSKDGATMTLVPTNICHNFTGFYITVCKHHEKVSMLIGRRSLNWNKIAESEFEELKLLYLTKYLMKS